MVGQPERALRAPLFQVGDIVVPRGRDAIIQFVLPGADGAHRVGGHNVVGAQVVGQPALVVHERGVPEKGLLAADVRGRVFEVRFMGFVELRDMVAETLMFVQFLQKNLLTLKLKTL